MIMRLRKFVKPIFFIAIFCLMFMGLTELVKDKRITFEYDVTRKINGFYNEPKDSLDFVFIGSSQLFGAVAPAVLWNEYGITSYDFGANEQPFWISYHYIKEVIKYQKPKAVVLDIRYCFLSEEYATEGVTRINLDNLMFSKNKIEAINDSVPENERWSYYLELIKYHSNWQNLNKNHFQDVSDIKNPYKGYTPFLHYREYPAEIDASYSQTTDKADIPERSKEYLLKIIELSKNEGFELLLLKIPDSDPYGQQLYNTVAQIAAENDVPFINYNTIMSGENHMNIINAEKFTSHLGTYLREHYNITDKRDNPEYSSWHSDSEYFYQEKQKYLTRNETNVINYLNLIDNPHYLVFISVKDEASTNINMLSQQLQSLGIMQGFEGKYRHGYIGIIDSKNVIYEDIQNEPLKYDIDICDMKIQIISQGYEVGSLSSIMIDGKELSKNQRGLNIVVYDKLLKEIVDSVAFDTFDQLQCFR